MPWTVNNDKFKTYVIAFSFILIFSCDRPTCENKNYIFDHFAPETNQYKEELAQQLEVMKDESISYWFDKYKSNNKKEFILIYIQGNGLCAKGLVTVNNWRKLEGIKRTKGKGYHGAELVGLKISVHKTLTETELILKDVDYILD